MIEVIPAILPQDKEHVAEHLARIRGVARMVQIDVVDGSFAEGKTWPYVDSESFEAIASEEEGLPMWEEFEFEVDLMVTEAKEAALAWVRAGASRIVVHVESVDDRAALESLQEYRSIGVEVGVAISLDTPLEKLSDLTEFCSFIQVMGIAEIGRQGEPFDERAVVRVSQLRALYPQQVISVDGGVNERSMIALIDAGATRLVMGSAIWNGDAKENYLRIKDGIEGTDL